MIKSCLFTLQNKFNVDWSKSDFFKVVKKKWRKWLSWKCQTLLNTTLTSTQPQILTKVNKNTSSSLNRTPSLIKIKAIYILLLTFRALILIVHSKYGTEQKWSYFCIISLYKFVQLICVLHNIRIGSVAYMYMYSWLVINNYQ